MTNDPNLCAFIAESEGFLDGEDEAAEHSRRTARWHHQRYHGRHVRRIAKRLRF